MKSYSLDAFMRGRQGQISSRKIKTNLLAAVLILTVIPKSVRIGWAIIEHCCFLISQKLVEADEVISFTMDYEHLTHCHVLAVSDRCALRENSDSGIDIRPCSSLSMRQVAVTWLDRMPCKSRCFKRRRDILGTAIGHHSRDLQGIFCHVFVLNRGLA